MCRNLQVFNYRQVCVRCALLHCNEPGLIWEGPPKPCLGKEEPAFICQLKSVVMAMTLLERTSMLQYNSKPRKRKKN